MRPGVYKWMGERDMQRISGLLGTLAEIIETFFSVARMVIGYHVHGGAQEGDPRKL